MEERIFQISIDHHRQDLLHIKEEVRSPSSGDVGMGAGGMGEWLNFTLGGEYGGVWDKGLP